MLRIVFIACLCTFFSAAFCQAAQTPAQFNRDAEVRAAVTAYVQQKTAGLGWEIRLRRISVNGTPRLPEGELQYEVLAPRQWEGWGAASLAVVARQNERVVGNIPVQVDVEALADMVVTLRQLDHGTTITAADIAVQRRDVAAVAGKFTLNPGDLTGKRARSTIKANAAVRLDQVEKVPLIKSGQMVTIVAENEVLKITVAGRARSAGAVGDVIMVQNLNSQKEIPARVVNATTVQVSF
ncbi:MAG: flagellar basal body P-ring formation protein FlgA [Deltaproteobacteria bacterium]|nr:flagellar basal body P-ring formation protein FlgA [Deltaproteobacteria bacterium]